MYDLDAGRLAVQYSHGRCSSAGGWDVPEYTVTGLFLRFERKIRRKDLPLNPKKFRKYPIKDSPGAFVFENGEDGIEFVETRTKSIESISFDPPTKHSTLSCRETPSNILFSGDLRFD